jgi:sec-independent protein translocase protein TatA
MFLTLSTRFIFSSYDFVSDIDTVKEIKSQSASPRTRQGACTGSDKKGSRRQALSLDGNGFPPYNIPIKETNMFGSLGIWEILLIVVVIALLFGGKKLPELGKGLGQGIKNFKNAVKGTTADKDEESSKDEKGN